jgi:tetratricopeptide (TPR) repeat protein
MTGSDNLKSKVSLIKLYLKKIKNISGKVFEKIFNSIWANKLITGLLVFLGIIIYPAARFLMPGAPEILDNNHRLQTLQALDSSIALDNPRAFKEVSKGLKSALPRINEIKEFDEAKEFITFVIESRREIKKRNYKKAYNNLEQALEKKDTLMSQSLYLKNLYDPFNPVNGMLLFSRLKNYIVLAVLALKNNNPDLAEKWFEKAENMIELLPGPNKIFSRAFVLVLKERPDQARKLIESAAPDETDAYAEPGPSLAGELLDTILDDPEKSRFLAENSLLSSL